MNHAKRRLMRATVLPVLCALSIPACKREEPPPPIAPARYTAPPAQTQPAGGADAILPVFTDITAAAGITFTHHNGAFGAKWMPETVGAGGGFLDYDNDGDPDILLINGCDWPGHENSDRHPTPGLYRNDGAGRFEDVTIEAGLDRITYYGMGFAAADYDADGDEDLLLTGVGRNILLRNDDGRFVDVTASHLVRDAAAAQPDDVPDWSTGAAWLDHDLDGDLDLLVCNYVAWSPETDVFTTLDGVNKSYATPRVYQGRTSRLFENRDGGRLVEATLKAGVYNADGKSMSALVADFNEDARPDVFITNDTEPNFLFLNRGGGRFEDVGLVAGCGFDENGRARAGMGVDAAELTGAGDLCVAIGNFSNEPVSLYERLGDTGLFVDAAGKARLSRPTLLNLTFGLLFADFDLDGRTDLMLANGHIEPAINAVQREVTFAQKPQLFRNIGGGRFEEITDRVGAGFAVPLVGRALAYADMDGDGDLDVLFTANNDRPRLLRNDLPEGNHALRVRLRAAGRNPDALGAVVVAVAGERRQTRSVRTGGSYLSQSELVVTFGLGRATQAALTVRWPGGRTEPLGTLAAGYTYTVMQGHGPTAREPFAPRS